MFGLQVFKWLRPNVKQRGKPPGSGTIHIAKQTVSSILATAGTPYSLEDMRKMCLKLGPETTLDFRSWFMSKEQETATKFPRDKAQDDMLVVIDSLSVFLFQFTFTCITSSYTFSAVAVGLFIKHSIITFW